MEELPKASEKLINASIKPIQWPKVPDYVEDSLITAVQQACK